MMKHLQIFLLLCGVVWVPILLTYSYNTQSREGKELYLHFTLAFIRIVFAPSVVLYAIAYHFSFTSFLLMLVFCFYNFGFLHLHMIPLGMSHCCFLLDLYIIRISR